MKSLRDFQETFCTARARGICKIVFRNQRILSEPKIGNPDAVCCNNTKSYASILPSDSKFHNCSKFIEISVI